MKGEDLRNPNGDYAGLISRGALASRPLDGRTAAAEDQRDDEEHEEDKEQDLGDVREVALKPDEAEQSGDQGENGKNKSPSEHDLVSLRGCGTSLSGCPGEIIGFGSLKRHRPASRLVPMRRESSGCPRHRL